MKLKHLTLPSLFLASFVLVGCPESANTPVDVLAQKAKEAAERSAAMTLTPHEINMIEWRREFMGKPGLILYIVFFNDMGQPIEYFVSGKCTSSNKRLIPAEHLVQGRKSGWDGDFVMSAPSEDGTYGPSDEYIYCFTVDGKYKQWNGDYYASSTPIELTIKPLIVDLVKPGEAPKNQSQH
ncbi:MAG: hypothetical protein Q8P36_01485 [bacterium]|nr:hypothetical protein [bacterium]